MTARWRWGALAVSVWAIASLMHLRFSLWLVVPHETPFGSVTLADLVPAVAAIGGVVLLATIALQLRRAPRPGLVAGYWIAWAAAVVAMVVLFTLKLPLWERRRTCMGAGSGGVVQREPDSASGWRRSPPPV